MPILSLHCFQRPLFLRPDTYAMHTYSAVCATAEHFSKRLCNELLLYK